MLSRIRGEVAAQDPVVHIATMQNRNTAASTDYCGADNLGNAELVELDLSQPRALRELRIGLPDVTSHASDEW